ncbi:citryl-CoA lyase [Mycolicibacterium goodii]|uniref:Citrate synthase n=1 Tax=Mycolicibacterium goodii TaxID=134601 RepID=A0A0K0XFR5_MYCGD|nr:citrate synthase [Mycolicibacterium goodii]
MTQMAKYPTALGVSTKDTISLMGHDLPNELIGQISFGELAFRLITLREPSRGQLRVFEAVLTALADHGFTPTALAARLTYLSAPEALQGALAAGLLGGGSRFLGVSEDTAKFLQQALATVGEMPTSPEGWDDVAMKAIAAHQGFIPGLGHHLHKDGDPRTPVLIGIAREEGCYGPHLALLEAVGRVAPKKLPVNGAGTCGAALADIGIPVELCRGVALLARTAGLLGHLAEELRSPIARTVFDEVESNAVYRSP